MSNTVRTLIGALALSAAGLVGIAMREGYTERATAPLPGDVPTYGLGSTRRPDGSAVRDGDTIKVPAALQLTLREIRAFEGALKGCVTAELTQGEYDSLVSLAYNVGADAVCKSTMVKLHNAGSHAEACEQFDRWTFFKVGTARTQPTDAWAWPSGVQMSARNARAGSE